MASSAPAKRKASAPSGSRGVGAARRYAVIMAGGSGTRFWPWSREALPKQMLALSSSRSMLAETVARLSGIVAPERVFVVTGARYRRQVLHAVPELPRENVLAEPVGRNTAACIGWATLEVLRRRPDAVTAVLAADHLIGGGKAFARDLATAFRAADEGRRLITFGIPPTSPATGYGYIRSGRSLGGGVRAVEAFVEKPNLARARSYVAGGKYFWNSGMFVWRADVAWRELGTYLPGLARDLLAMEARRRRGVLPPAVLAECYPRLESISIDYGVLERSPNVAVLPASFSWSDIGSWDAVAGLWPADASGNASRDPVVAVDASNNVVASGGKPVVLLGVRDLVVVDAGDAILVCDRERCQDVKTAVGRLEGAGLGRLR